VTSVRWAFMVRSVNISANLLPRAMVEAFVGMTDRVLACLDSRAHIAIIAL